jgi:hypothetical protein
LLLEALQPSTARCCGHGGEAVDVVPPSEHSVFVDVPVGHVSGPRMSQK